jgi:hypothetical protein
MKYFINKCIIIILFSTMLFSLAEGIGFGVKAGMNIANMHGDDIGRVESRIGFCGGGFVTFGLGDVFAIQPEMLYTQKGWRYEQHDFWAFYERTWILHYIEIPLLSKIMIPVKGSVKPNVFVGPYFGVNVGAKERWISPLETREDDIANFQDSEFGMVFSAGVDYVLSKGKIGFEGRYTLGLTTTSEIWDYMKNDVISFMLVYSF